MSLDVYLEYNEHSAGPERWAIFIREDGQRKEITLEEWNKRHPWLRPTLCMTGGKKEIYNGNITHNLATMADQAGLYNPLWRPGTVSISQAEQLIEPLETGLAELCADPDKYKAYNPENGWGDYDTLVRFVEEYLDMCRLHPKATVSVWR